MVRAYNRTASSHPVISTGQLEGSQQDIGQTAPVAIAVKDGAVELSPQAVVVADKVYGNEKMAMLAFFNEMITYRITPTTDKAAEKVFEIIINGTPYFHRRGESYTRPRFVLDRLIRCKQTVYGQEEAFNSEGIKTIRYPSVTALKYDYVIEHDGNPRGKHWERAVLAEMS